MARRARLAAHRATLVAVAAALAALVGLAAAAEPCKGTPERPAHALVLEGGKPFCLRMPRFLPKPEHALAGTASFPRTFKDTVGRRGGGALGSLVVGPRARGLAQRRAPERPRRRAPRHSAALPTPPPPFAHGRRGPHSAGSTPSRCT
jgi:hypothetical protein